MKRIPLIHALAIALASAVPTLASAADAVAPKAATPEAKPVDAQAARAELAELRAQMQELSRRMGKLSGQLGDAGPRAYAMRYLGDPDRGMIGVVVSRSGKSGKELQVSAVTPGSPAARAGIRVGDVITGLSTRNSVRSHSDQDESEDDGLNAVLRNLKVDQDLTVEVRRDGKTLKFPLKAERREPYVIADAIGDASIDSPQMRADIERAQHEAERAMHDAQRANAERIRAGAEQSRANAEDMRRSAQELRRNAGRMRVEMLRDMPWWGLNMAPLNTELGHYFGADKGALVLAANAQALPGLRGGDVITRVADQDIARPEDVLRTLRDQPAGKNVPIRVLRERKTIALDVKAPEFNSIFEVAPPLPPTPPLPPAEAPPAPPAPPTPLAKPPHAPAAPSAPTAPQAPEGPDSEMSDQPSSSVQRAYAASSSRCRPASSSFAATIAVAACW